MTLAAGKTAPGRRADTAPRDAVSLLTVYVVLLFAIPSDRFLPGVGAAGSPAALWGLGLALWWLWFRVRGGGRVDDPRRRLIRRLVAALAVAVLISYLAAMTRAIPAVEVNPADNGLLRMASWAGVALVAADGIPSSERLLVLLRRIAVAGGAVALLGILEFALKRSLTASIQIPGLVSGGAYSDLVARGDFVRSSATAQHPLEYGMLLAMVLPIALTLALTAPSRWRPVLWTATALVALALVVAGSRSAIVGLVLCIAPLVPTWAPRVRLWMSAAAVALVGAVYVLVPGLIGTLRGLFENAGDDSSTVSRADSYGVFLREFPLSPVVGRGFGTFLPMYRIFDNQYLGLLIEVGVLGTLAFAALLAVPAVLALTAARGVEQPGPLRQLGAAFVGALLAGLVITAFFDALSFPKAGGMLFLVAGLAGAYRSLVVADPLHRPSARVIAGWRA